VAELLHDLQIILAVWGGGGESSGGAEEEIMRRLTSEPGIASRSYARLEAGNVDGQGERSMSEDLLMLGDKAFKSRLIVGTGSTRRWSRTAMPSRRLG